MGTTQRKRAERALLGALVVLILGLAGWVGSDHLLRMDRRVEEIESRLASQPIIARALDQRLADVRREIQAIRAELSTTQRDAGEVRTLAERLSGAELVLDDIGRVIEAQHSSLIRLQEAQASFGPDTLEAKLAEHDRTQLERWDDLRHLIATTSGLADESRRRLEQLKAELVAHRDVVAMWKDLIGPVVQLAGPSSVGSGTLLESIPNEEGEFETYLLTAWHVVRDIIEGDEDVEIPVTIYRQDGSRQLEFAQLLVYETDLDVALLRLETKERIENGAKLATRERVENIKIFDRVYAVGCPLGNDPIPSPGEISTYRHEVDGITYWMINAPTYIGNSGGGIFDAETHALLGIFSKIYTHGALRPTIVPHMGLVTPLGNVYDWLETVGYVRLVPQESKREVAEAR